jgi:hypothetical protein
MQPQTIFSSISNIQVAELATAVRNTVFHGGNDIIPNFEDKKCAEEDCQRFTNNLQNLILELLSMDWKNAAVLEKQILPTLFANLAVYPSSTYSATSAAARPMTISSLHTELKTLYPELRQAIHVHDKPLCEAQLEFYSQKLIALKALTTQNKLVKKHAVGYLRSRLSTYAMHLKQIDEDCFKGWCKKLQTIDIKLGAQYRHNKYNENKPTNTSDTNSTVGADHSGSSIKASMSKK